MGTVLVQFSDMHFRAPKGDNPLWTRASELYGALRSETSPGDTCAVVVSGDIVYKGCPDGYGVAAEFLGDVYLELSDHTGHEPLLVFVPWNHDHDFSHADYDEQMRERLIESASPTIPMSPKVSAELLVTQEAYRKFIQQMRGQLSVLAVENMIAASTTQLGSVGVCFHLLNTTRLTRSREQPGKAWYPLEILGPQLSGSGQDGLLSVGVLHHPYNWHHPDNASGLRKLLESHCDIILTGHEHQAGHYSKSGKSTEQNLYVEGGVLQDHDEPMLSTFNVVRVNLERKEFSCRTIGWSGTIFEPQVEASQHKYIRLRQPLQAEFALDADWSAWLDEMGTDFRHPRCRDLRLRDMFVYPDLAKFDIRKACRRSGLVRDREVLGYIQSARRVLIAGAEKTGKTCLAKALFLGLKEAGLVPLLVRPDFSVGRSAGAPVEERIREAFDVAVRRTYAGQSAIRFWQSRIQDRALIIDDYQRLPMAPEARGRLLAWCESNFGVVVAIADPSIRMQEVLGGGQTETALWTYEHLDILECDAETRDALVGRWLQAGADPFDSTCAQDSEHQAVRYCQTIDALVGQGAIPSVPLFVLMLMQQLESGAAIGSPSGMYGSLYEMIIRDVVTEVAKKPTEVEVLLNYLTEFANALHVSGQARMIEEVFGKWHAEYCTTFSVSLSSEELVRRLTGSGILAIDGASLRFKYRYYHCFFLARYLANHVHQPSAMGDITGICSRLHQSDAANTMMFLCHMSRDPQVLRLVLEAARRCFPNADEYDLSRTPNVLPEGGLRQLPLALPDGPREDQRRAELRRRDEAERPQGLAEVGDDRPPPVGDADANRLYQVTSALHAVKICGQIVRNFYGSLTGNQQHEIIRECFGTTLRTIAALIDLLERDKEAFGASFANRLRLAYPAMEPAEVEGRARQSVHFFAVAICLAFVKNASEAVGLADLKTTLDTMLAQQSSTVSTRMLDLSARLDFLDGLPDERILSIAKEIRDNSIGFDVLRCLVWTHLVLFSSPYDRRQRVCDRLGITGSTARLLIGGERKVRSAQ